MKTRQLLPLALALGITAGLCSAQTPGNGTSQGEPNHQPPGRPPGPPHGPPPPLPILVVLDGDRDGILSADEIANAPAGLRKLDKDGSGDLTREEFLPPPPPGGPQGPPPDSSNGTRAPRNPTNAKAVPERGGRPSRDRAQGEPPQGPPPGGRPPMPLIEALDADHDGTISAAEMDGAPEALLKLDRTQDGQLGPGEYCPPRPPRHEGTGAPDGAKPQPSPSE